MVLYEISPSSYSSLKSFTKLLCERSIDFKTKGIPTLTISVIGDQAEEFERLANINKIKFKKYNTLL